jgi:hypothetical protein
LRAAFPGLLLVMAFAPAVLRGQDESAPAAPAAPQAPAGNTVLMEPDTSGLYFEWALTAVGIGAAMFVVCRSSRRN